MKSNGIAANERAVLCVLLNDSHAIIPVQNVLDDPQMFSETLHRQVYAAVLELTRQSIVPNVYTVSEKTGIALADAQKLAAGFNTKMSREVLYSADLILREAAWRKLEQAVAESEAVIKERRGEPEEVGLFCAQMLTVSIDKRNDESPQVEEVSKRFDAEVVAVANGSAGVQLGSKLAFLQDKTSGLRPGHIWMITAPYKGRKTTLMRNLVLQACRSGASVDVFALEGTETGTYAGLTAMLATEKLLTWGCREQAFLSETFIMRGQRSPDQEQAISEARAELNKWNLRIYDARKGITNPDKLLHFIKRDRFMFDLGVYAVDYLQLLGEGKLFDRIESATHHLQQVTVEERLTALILAQLNEATIWQKDESYSPGVKGGGDPAAAADFLIRTKYDGATAPDILTVQLKLARHARPGTQRYVINPQSGLILREDGRASEE